MVAQPLKQMNGHASFNQVFITDAETPDAYVVGGTGNGWRVLQTALAYERAVMGVSQRRSDGAGGATAKHVRQTVANARRVLLADFFVARGGNEMGAPGVEVAPPAMKALQAYAWPGNVRELKNVIERAILLSDRRTLTVRDLRFEADPGNDAPAGVSMHMTLEELEQWYVEQVLREESGHVDSAAKRLAIPRSSLYSKLKKWRRSVSRS